MSLRLRLLGGARLELEGEPVRGRATHRRRLALLALLALAHPRGLTRERIVAFLWPEHDSDGARRLLSEALYVLRKDLGEGIITTVGEELSLDAALCTSDVADFLAASAAGDHALAASLYGGAFLDGWYVAGAPDLDEWMDRERARLAAAYVAALEALATGAEATGDHNAAVAYWRALTHADPLSSRIAVHYARALAANGDRAAALLALSAHESRLRAEDFPVEAEVLQTAEELRREPEPSAARRQPPAPTPLPPPAPGPAVERPGDGGAAAAGAEFDSGERQAAVAAAPAVPAVRPAYAVRPLYGWLAAASLLVVAAIAAATAPWRARTAAAGDSAAAVAPSVLDPNRVAVLYLDDHSPGGQQAHLAYGLTESLINELGSVDGLDVVSRHGVKPFRDHAVPLDSIARALRVGSIVEGSVQRSGDRIRVTVQLIDAQRNAHLDTRTIERDVGELFALQDDVAREVATLLRRRLGEHVQLGQAARETDEPRALELFMRAEADREAARRVARSGNARDEQDARRLLARVDSVLDEVERIDPKWARPRVARAGVALDMASLTGAADRVRLLRRAVEHADRALRLAPTLAVALEARGAAHWRLVNAGASSVGRLGELARAEADLRAATRQDPALASAWATLSQLLRYQGATGEANDAADRALRADAYLMSDTEIIEQLYRAAFAAGDLPEARNWCGRGRRNHPRDWRFIECELTLLFAGTDQPPDPARAWAIVRELEVVDAAAREPGSGRTYSPIYRRMAAATVSARAGDRERALATLDSARQAVAADSVRRIDLLFGEAHLRLALGQPDSARSALDAFLRARPHLRDFVLRDPVLSVVAPVAPGGTGGR